jgi:hypothetical protein
MPRRKQRSPNKRLPISPIVAAKRERAQPVWTTPSSLTSVLRLATLSPFTSPPTDQGTREANYSDCANPTADATCFVAGAVLRSHTLFENVARRADEPSVVFLGVTRRKFFIGNHLYAAFPKASSRRSAWHSIRYPLTKLPSRIGKESGNVETY